MKSLRASLSTKKEYNVTAIADEAFNSAKNLEKLIINDNIKSIGSEICDKVDLKEVTLPFTGNDAAGTISNKFSYAFGIFQKECTVTINEITIKDEAFEDLELNNIILGSNVLHIGKKSFADVKVNEIKLSNNLKSIGEEAFYSASFDNIIIPISVSDIRRNAFSGFAMSDSMKIWVEAESVPRVWDSSWVTGSYIDFVYYGNQWDYVNGVPTLI